MAASDWLRWWKFNAKLRKNCAFSKRELFGIVISMFESGKTYKSSVFIPPLKKAQDHGLKLTLHTAEIPDVEDALILLQLHPDRIGHGTCLHPDQGGSQQLIDIVKQQSIPLELCLTSNVQCHSVSSYDDHHMWYWYNENHPFILATDDKGVFSTTLSQEYKIMMDTLKLSAHQVWDVSYRAIDHVFADETVKTTLRQIWHSTKKNLLDS